MRYRYAHSSFFKLSPVALAVMSFWAPVAQANLEFDPSMLSSDNGQVADLSRFEQGGGTQLPGDYLVTVYLNGAFIESRHVRFQARDTAAAAGEDVRDGTGLMACLTRQDLRDLGVNTDAYPGLRDAADGQCLSPGQHIRGAFTAFDFLNQRLDISIPQVALQNKARGWIPPKRWDNGINAALLNYQFSGNQNKGQYGNSSSQFLNLTSGLNFGPWRLRDNSTWTDTQSRYSHSRRWQHLSTYAQRAIIPWRSELTAGDSTTGSEVFDAISFRGVQLATDDSMYPDSQRGFAPDIRGTAMSNAQVTVRQNGNVIYQTVVAPGEFDINDLYPVTSGGDLEVTVTENGGSVRTFTVPYSSVPVLQRQGHIRYALTAGHYRSSSDQYDQPAFAQGTLQWGLPHGITVYGGTQVADHYQSAALGSGVNMGGWGALSVDLTQANSVLADGSRHEGQSVRFLYGRSLISTGTTVQLAGYRYSTEGFHTLQETATKRMTGWLNDSDEVDAAGRPVARRWTSYYNLYNSRRERIELNISQSLGESSSLYATGTHQTYWHSDATTESLQAGFSNTYHQLSWTLSYGYSRISDHPKADRTYFASLSVPLVALLSHDSGHNIWANYSVRRDADGTMTQQAGLSGTALSENNLNWGISQGYSRQDGESGDLSLALQGTYGNLSAGYGYTADYRQVRYGMSGGMIAHRGGLTFGQPLGETNVLIAVPGAAGVPLENGTGIHTDWRGYTVMPYASMYRDNRVALDVSRLDDHTDVDNAVAHVVPTRGAIVRANFAAHSGVRVMMTLRHNGSPLPFGSTVVSGTDGHESLVADGGVVYLSGLPLTGTLKAQWGRGAGQQCSVRYRLPAEVLHQALAQAEGECL